MSARGELEKVILDARVLVADTEADEGRSRALSLVKTKLDEAMMWLDLDKKVRKDE